MMHETKFQLSPAQQHLEILLNKIETADALDVGFLFSSLDRAEFQTAFKKIVLAYKEKTGNDFKTELIIAINDPALKHIYPDTVRFLRFLKAMREDRFFRKHISRIVVKGPQETVALEPNVFASDVQFELMV